jgi:ankyrin repeat protein
MLYHLKLDVLLPKLHLWILILSDVAVYLISKGCKLRLQDFDGRSALHMACSLGDVQVVQTLMALNSYIYIYIYVD